ncbi:helix-turn-helix domain-containing protein [Pseudogracilibacillus sp. ICA-222130]
MNGMINTIMENNERGNTYWGIDEDTRERLRTKLMQSVLAFKI